MHKRRPVVKLAFGRGTVGAVAAVSAALCMLPNPASAQCAARWLAEPYSLPGIQGPGSSPGATELAFMALWQPPGASSPWIVVSGQWTSLGGQDVNAPVAAWTGSSWTSLSGLDPIMYGNPRARPIAVLPNGDLVTSGTRTVQSATESGVFRRVGDDWQPLGGAPLNSGLDNVKEFCVTPSGELLAAGNRVWRWTGSSWTELDPSGSQLGGGPTAIVSTQTGALFGLNGWKQLIAWNQHGWALIGSASLLQITSGWTLTSSLAISPDGRLIMAGVDRIDGAEMRGLAVWSGSSWAPLSSEPVRPQMVEVMANGDLVVAGLENVTSLPGGRYLARWNGTSWSTFGSGPTGPVTALLPLPDGGLIIAGQFTYVDGVPANGIARWGVPTSPTIGSQPTSQIVTCGGVAQFSTSADGQGGPQFRWRRGGVNLSNGPTGTGATIFGATSPTLQIFNARAGDSGGYDCVVSSVCGTASTETAALTVLNCCPADFNGNGERSPQDIFAFLNVYFAGCS